MHDPTKVRYNVAPTCGLYRFVKYVRKHVPKDWTSNISDPVVHMTMKRPDNTGNGSSTASNDDSRAGVGCNHPSLYCHCKPHWSFWGWWCHDCSNTGRLKNYNITEDGGETCLRIGRHAEIKYKTIASGPDLGYSLWISNIWVDQGLASFLGYPGGSLGALLRPCGCSWRSLGDSLRAFCVQDNFYLSVNI